MRRRGKQREGRTPLVVKEFILPCGHDNPGSRKNSTFRRNNDRVIMEGGQEITGHVCMKTEQDEKEVLSLMVLQEKPLESYFEGTRKGKKIRKRKRKRSRIVIPPSELLSDGAQTLSKGDRKQTEKALTEEEETEIKLLDLKIYEYEKIREQAQKENYVRQKVAEEDYICQLENLAAKWFKSEKRRGETKKVDDDLALPKSFPEETPNRRIKEISTSRECPNENPELPPGESKMVFKEKYQPVQAQPTDSVLVDDFYEKLVFVDEDSDEFDCDVQNLQFRRSLRKH